MPDDYEMAKSIITICDNVNKGSEIFGLATSFIKSFGALGGIASVIITLAKPQSNAVGEALKQISRKMNSICLKIDDSTNQLGIVVAEHYFTAEFIARVGTVEVYMRNVLEKQTSNCLRDFIKKCEAGNKTPYDLTLSILMNLRESATNVMSKAMQADPRKTKATYDKWEKIIKSLLSRLGVLHCFYIGVTCRNKCEAYVQYDLMDEAVKNCVKRIEQIKDTDTGYWPKTVERIIHETVDNNMHVGNKAKADIFVNILSQIHTKDEFYIMVYNDCGGYDKHCFNYNEDQCICVFRRGKCNVVIYRSKEAHDPKEESLQTIKSIVEKNRYGAVLCLESDGFKDSCNQLYQHTPKMVGFVGIIGDHDLVVKDVSRRNGGPGWWLSCDSTTIRRNGRGEKKITLIIGYW